MEVDTAGQDADGEVEGLPEFLADDDEAAADADDEQPHVVAAE
jgi:ParB family chromosome partitioning protein